MAFHTWVWTQPGEPILEPNLFRTGKVFHPTDCDVVANALDQRPASVLVIDDHCRPTEAVPDLHPEHGVNREVDRVLACDMGGWINVVGGPVSRPVTPGRPA